MPTLHETMPPLRTVQRLQRHQEPLQSMMTDSSARSPDKRSRWTLVRNRREMHDRRSIRVPPRARGGFSSEVE